jgi:hypothetical protein
MSRQLKDWGIIADLSDASIDIRVWDKDQTLVGLFTVDIPTSRTLIKNCTWSGAGWQDTYVGAEVVSITNGDIFAAPVDDLTTLDLTSGIKLITGFGMGISGVDQGQSAVSAYGGGGGVDTDVTNSSSAIALDGGSFAMTNAMQTIVTQGGTDSPELSLGAGTWLIIGWVSIVNGATAGDGYQAEFYNVTDAAIVGVNTASPRQVNAAAISQIFGIPLMEVITLAATKTIGIRARNIAASRGSVSAGRTNIAAIRLS